MKPLFRIPLLIGTVIATVATSAPAWQVADHTDRKLEHVEPSAAVETRLEIEASHRLNVGVTVDKLVSREGKLRIEVIDSRPECRGDATFESDDGIWRVGQTSSGGAPTWDSKLHRIDFHPSCFSTEKRATLTLRFVNEGTVPLDFEWQASALSSGDESNDAPDDAFAEVKVMP